MEQPVKILLMGICGYGSNYIKEVSEREIPGIKIEGRTISAMAAENGIKIALEWHKNTVTDTNESAQDFLDEAAAENLYCLWQPTVALNMTERCAGLDMLERRGRLLNLHVYYWLEGNPARQRGRRRAALPDGGFRGKAGRALRRARMDSRGQHRPITLPR